MKAHSHFQRAVVLLQVFLQVSFTVPLPSFAAMAVTTPRAEEGSDPAGRKPSVMVNRTLPPDARSVPASLERPKQPSAEALYTTAIFPEPLVPVGRPPTAEENLAPALAQTNTPIPWNHIGLKAGADYKGDGLAVTPLVSGARLHCAFQRLNAEVSREGLWLASIVPGQPQDRFRVKALTLEREVASPSTPPTSVGTGHRWGNDGLLPSTGRVVTDGQIVRFVRSGVVEEYSVTMDGVRQDFVVMEKPPGEGELRLRLDTAGALVETAACGAQLVLEQSGRKIAYSRLRVTDAKGRKLPARFDATPSHRSAADTEEEADGGLPAQRYARLAIMVDDANAVYPVRIDPTFSDANWVSLGGIPGANNAVYATATDGAGNLYIGGDFTVAGDVIANRIAKWNGSAWSALGLGMNGVVRALVVSGGDLYAGGGFTMAGGSEANRIAKWNGSTWSALGSGMDGPVFALVVSGSDLYAGGGFASAGGSAATNIARWNGSAWSALGLGVNSTVFALALSGSDLYAAGNFLTADGITANRIARWDGSVWSALGPGLNNSAAALAISGSNVYVGGAFTTAGGSTANRIAKWNGSTWSALGAGVSGQVSALLAIGSDVYAGGAFTRATNSGGVTVSANFLAKWNGSAWSSLGTGMGSQVYALAVSGSDVYAGGLFSTAGGSAANRIAKWNSSVWSGLGVGMNEHVRALAVSGNNVYVGGAFSIVGGIAVNYIARWDGGAWNALGTGMNNWVSALVVSSSNLYAGGSFTTAGGNPANRIAKWNGSVWSPLGVGVDSVVNALASSGSDLYAGGIFTTAGGSAANYVAKWDGVEWSALGSGVNDQITALAMSGSDLYAGGNFTTAGGNAANRIAKWDGSAWTTLGTGMNSAVLALAMSGSDVYAGGDFTLAGGSAASRIAKWNGSGWNALGSGMNNTVYALEVVGSDLYAGGIFSTAGGSAANCIAKWNGSAWSALGSGVNGRIYALAESGTDFFAGGEFTVAGDKVSGYAAKAILTLAPTNITLNGSSVAENQPPGALVGVLTAQDPNSGDMHTFALVGGAGSTDNSSFAINNGTNLVTASVFDYETKSSCNIRVRATDDSGLTFEKTFTIAVANVNEAPFANPGGPYVITGGAGVTLDASGSVDPDTSSGDSIASHAWDLNNDSTYDLSSGLATMALSWAQLQSYGLTAGIHTIRLRVTDSFGATGKQTTTLTINVPPAITLHPASQNVRYGSNATFSVTASGFPVLGYQWYRNGAAVFGATASNLTLTASAATAGSYIMVVSNAVGSATSAVAVLSYVPITGTNGLNFTDGWPIPGLTGETADGCSDWVDSWPDYYFGGGALGSKTMPNDLWAQWNSANTWYAGWEDTSEQQLYRTYLDDGEASLVTGDGIGVSVTISNLGNWLLANNAVSYRIRCYASSDYPTYPEGSFKPVSIRLGAPNPADGVNQLLNLPVLETFTISNHGDGAFPDDTGAGGIRGYGDSSSSNTANVITLTIPCRDDDPNRGTLAGFTLEYLMTDLGQPPAVVVNPSSATVPCGQAFTLSVGAVGSLPLAYEWRLNGTPIPGGTSASYAVNPANVTNGGAYTVIITNAFGAATSSVATVVVQDTTPPAINCGQNETVMCEQGWGFTVPIVTDDCDPNPTVIPLSTATNFGCGYSYVTTRIWLASDAAGNTTTCTQVVSLVDFIPPTITACPGPLTVQCLTEVPAPNPSLVQANHQYDPCETTPPVITHVGDVTNGVNPILITRTYRASDVCGNAATCTQTITVQDTTPPTILCSDNLTAVATNFAGAVVEFSVHAADACAGSVSASCVPPSGSLFPPGTNTVLCGAADPSGNTNFCSFTITVEGSAPPVILTQPQTQFVPVGGTAGFVVRAEGAQPLGYQWRKGGGPLVGATASSYALAAVAAADAGIYDVVVTNVAGSVTSAPATLLAFSAGGPVYAWTNFAGQPGGWGTADGVSNMARFQFPLGVAVDGAGHVYVADKGNHTIRKITPAGVVTTLAGRPGSNGNADGAGGAARFSSPAGVAVDGTGHVYVADQINHTIRKITPAGIVTTLAGQAGAIGSTDGTGGAARFNHPSALAVDEAGNLLVADRDNHTLRKVTPAGVVTTLAGLAGSAGGADGTGSAARFNRPAGVAVDSAGNVFVAEAGNHTIRRVTPAGMVTTMAGLAGSAGSFDGTGSAARFNEPSGVVVDPAGNVFVADTYNHALRKVNPTGVVTTLAGMSGPGHVDGTNSTARFYQPSGLGLDSAGNLLVGDWGNHVIRKATPAGVVSTVAGSKSASGSVDGMGSAARFWGPGDVAEDGAGNVFVTDFNNQTLRKVTPGGVVTTVAGSAGSSGMTDGLGSSARFNGPLALTVDSAGSVIVADLWNHTIRKVTAAGEVTTLAGSPGVSGSADGTGSAARFYWPRGIALDAAGNLYVGDAGNHTIRKISPTGVVTTLAGSAGLPGSANGTGSAARFSNPNAVSVDSVGNLFVADFSNHTIRKISPVGVVTTFAGMAGVAGSADGVGSAARFTFPEGLAVDGAGNVFVADRGNHLIRKVSSAGVVTTIGSAVPVIGGADGIGAAANFCFPIGIELDGTGNLYVADIANNRITKGTPVLAPFIMVQPQGTTVACSGSASLSVTAVGVEPLTYQWYHGTEPVAGATATNLMVALSSATVGDYTVVVSNAHGAVTSSIANLEVLDTTPPTIICPPDVTVNADLGHCGASDVALGEAQVSDNCGVASITTNRPVEFPVGTTVVTWTVTDTSGNVSTCDQRVTVLDTQPPDLICTPFVTLPADPNSCSIAWASLPMPTVMELCGFVPILTNDVHWPLPIGTTLVTWTAVDDAGNVATCSQAVLVEGAAPPQLNCPANKTVPFGVAWDFDEPAFVFYCPDMSLSVLSTVTNHPPGVSYTATRAWQAMNGAGFSEICTQVVSVLGPYGGVPGTLPGIVQAENFDEGGEGVAYHDTEAANLGGSSYRAAGVDIGPVDGGGYKIAYSASGEWLNYTVIVQSNGFYRAVLRATSGSSGGVGRLDFSNGSQSNLIAVAGTGGWQQWSNFASAPFALTAGVQTMRFTYAQAAFDLDAIEVIPVTATVAGVIPGALKAEYYTNLTGVTLADLTNQARFLASAPDVLAFTAQFESRTNWADNYGARLSGWLIPPVSGSYKFYLASDDQGALFLSSDADSAHKALIASEPQWNGYRQFTNGQNQASRSNPPVNVSTNIPLVAGRAYYIEALVKEGAGGDGLSVAWLPPGGTAVTNGSAPIPGQFLAYGTAYVGSFQPQRAASLTNSGQIGISFGRLLDPDSATATTNYQVTGAVVTGAALSPDRQGVLLNVTALAETNFTVRVGAVRDIFGNSTPGTNEVIGTVLPQARQDIGTPGDPAVAGFTFSSYAGEFDVVAGGTDIWGTNDHGHFITQRRTGDFDMMVRVESLTRPDAWAKAGLVVRASIQPDSRNLAMLVAPASGQNTHVFQWRATNNGSTYTLHRGNGGPTNPPAFPNAWVRMKRAGSVFTCFTGTNGMDWTVFTARDTATNAGGAMPATMEVGLAVTSHNNASDGTAWARFRDFVMTAPDGNLPPVSAGFGATTPQGQLLAIPLASLMEPVSDPEGGWVRLVSVDAASTNGAPLFSNATQVVYSPLPDFTGADRFRYRVADSFGAESLIDAQIAVLPVGVMANKLDTPLANGGSLSLGFVGLPGRTYQVLRSSFPNGPWQLIGSLLVQPDGTGQFTDSDPPKGSGFYRLVLP